MAFLLLSAHTLYSRNSFPGSDSNFSNKLLYFWLLSGDLSLSRSLVYLISTAHSLLRCPFLTLTRHLHPDQIALGLGLQKTSIPYLGEHCIIQRSQISTYLINICASRRPCMIPASIRFPRRLRLIRVVFPNGSGSTQCSMVQLRRTDFLASLQWVMVTRPRTTIIPILLKYPPQRHSTRRMITPRWLTETCRLVVNIGLGQGMSIDLLPVV